LIPTDFADSPKRRFPTTFRPHALATAARSHLARRNQDMSFAEMLCEIVGLEFCLPQVKCEIKLRQNRSLEDRYHVIPAVFIKNRQTLCSRTK
jgi:predicted FMN-binding regulatory protein PaiB